MYFLELQRAISAHYIFFFAPLASVMHDLAQGTAQKNPGLFDIKYVNLY